MRRLTLLAGLLLLAPLAARATGPVSASSTTQTVDQLWNSVLASQHATDPRAIQGANLFPPNFSQLSPQLQAAFYSRLSTQLITFAAGRHVDDPNWNQLQALLTSPAELTQLLSTHQNSAALLWDAFRNNQDSQILRLLAAFKQAKVANDSLSLPRFLGGLSNAEVTRILTGQADPHATLPNRPGDHPGTTIGGRHATDGSPGGVLTSVGFDAGQAYGVPGDRHVYTDSAGNMISLSVSSRRMPDGTIEDVLHVVNINNRAAPMGATYSLRSDFAALQKGVDVSIGGVKFKLTLAADGDDHKITLSGDGGDFKNQKGEPPMSLSQLYAYRAARVFNYGRVVKIGGREYYAAPETYSQMEGDADNQKYVGYGQFAYWPKDQLDKLFAARPGHDEVDPQTFDFHSLDLSGSAFRGVRDMRPVMIATVIRREGGQDVALPRASLGQDQNGKWWDAVLKDGEYHIEEGQPPANAPDSNTPPGQTRTDGWPQLSQYSPDTPAAQALNGRLTASNVKVYEATSPQDPGKRFLILFDKDIKHAAFPPGTGGALDVVGGKTLSVQGADGNVSYFDLSQSGFQGGAPNFVAAGSFSRASGFQNIADSDVLRAVLGLAGYAPTDIPTILKNLDSQRIARGAASFNVSGPVAGGDTPLPIVVNFKLPTGQEVQQTIWPTVGDPQTGAPAAGPARTGFALDAVSPGTHPDNWAVAPQVGSQTLSPYWSSASEQGQTPGQNVRLPGAGAAGAVLYTAGTGTNRPYYLMFTVALPNGPVLRRGPVLVFGSGAHNAAGDTATRGALPVAPMHLGAVTVTNPKVRDSDLYLAPSATFPDGGYIALDVRGSGYQDHCLGIVAYWGRRFPDAAAAQAAENSRRSS